MKSIDWRIVLAGMLFLTVAECMAISQGINGTIFKIYIAIIAGAIGVFIPGPTTK